MPSNLIDPEDGENLAVRSFLSIYGSPGLKVADVREHMRHSGWEGYWPSWVSDVDGHLTKAGAQLWLRHLFSLEAADGVLPSDGGRDA